MFLFKSVSNFVVVKVKGNENDILVDCMSTRNKKSPELKNHSPQKYIVER